MNASAPFRTTCLPSVSRGRNGCRIQKCVCRCHWSLSINTQFRGHHVIASRRFQIVALVLPRSTQGATVGARIVCTLCGGRLLCIVGRGLGDSAVGKCERRVKSEEWVNRWCELALVEGRDEQRKAIWAEVDAVCRLARKSGYEMGVQI